MHDPKRPGDLLKVGGDPLDDAMDAARYGIYSWITASEKPQELRVREVLRPLAEQGDLTSALIRYQQMTAEERMLQIPDQDWAQGRDISAPSEVGERF